MMKIEDKIKSVLKKLKKTRNDNSIREITSDKLIELIKTNSSMQIVDVRSPQEFKEERIKFAINIPLYDLKKKAESILKIKEQLIIIYCEHGTRSKTAYRILEEKGYTDIYSLEGGIAEMDRYFIEKRN